MDSGIHLYIPAGRKFQNILHCTPMIVANIVCNFVEATETLHPQVKQLNENQTWDSRVSGHIIMKLFK